jgi:Clp protease
MSYFKYQIMIWFKGVVVLAGPRLPHIYGRGRRRDPIIAPGTQISQNVSTFGPVMTFLVDWVIGGEQQVRLCTKWNLLCACALQSQSRCIAIDSATALWTKRPKALGLLTVCNLPQDMVDLYNYLMRNRIIYVGSRITDEVRHMLKSRRVWHLAPCRAYFGGGIVRVGFTCFQLYPRYGFTGLDRACFCSFQVATNIVASLLALEMADDSADIRMYINSGGDVLLHQLSTVIRSFFRLLPLLQTF